MWFTCCTNANDHVYHEAHHVAPPKHDDSTAEMIDVDLLLDNEAYCVLSSSDGRGSIKDDDNNKENDNEGDDDNNNNNNEKEKEAEVLLVTAENNGKC